MMEEFFEITRYNLGAIPVEREATDVGLLVGQVADELRFAAEARDVGLATEVPEGMEALVDPAKMARVLENLVRNAISFADRGTCVRCRGWREGEGVALSVEDQGREIAPAHLKSIFEKFYRADAARGGGGAGLGLAIAKEIVEAHGGTIEAASADGLTTFTVRLPG